MTPANSITSVPWSGPARNRVSPLGGIVAAPGRGVWMGNRGILHAGRGSRDILRESRNRAWITCVPAFRGRRVPQWEPGHYTPLFFLDEAVAFAAGHRPCAECRRPAYRDYQACWAPAADEAAGGRAAGGATPRPRAPQLDQVLGRQRRRTHDSDWNRLPVGAFVLTEAGPAVVLADHLTLWRPDNSYGPDLSRPRRGTATVVTPAANLAVLHAGYPVQIDDAALRWTT